MQAAAEKVYNIRALINKGSDYWDYLRLRADEVESRKKEILFLAYSLLSRIEGNMVRSVRKIVRLNFDYSAAEYILTLTGLSRNTVSLQAPIDFLRQLKLL